MDKLLYISTAVPHEEVKRLQKKQYDFSSNALLPISIFHGNVISGLSQVYDEVTVLSGVPISHKNYKIFRYSFPKTKKGNVTYVLPGFFNRPIIKQVTMIVKMLAYIVKWSLKNKNHNANIIIDGTFFTGLLPLWIAKKLVRTNVMGIIVDKYSFMEPDGKSLSQKLYFKLLNSIDSFVFVTEQLEELVNAEHKKYMIMEGLVNEKRATETKREIVNCCVYAGGLHEIYGIKNLVDGFHESDVDCSLHLYGNGDTIEYIKEIAKIDSRIVYKGLATHDEILEIERSAKLLVNPRPVYGKLDTRFNFPSKLMEFMQSGRPVLTTKLLGIPKDYDEYMFYLDGDSKDSIKEGLKKVLSMDEKYLSDFGEKAKKYVNENKNSVVVAKRMFQMINSKGTKNEEFN